MRSSKAPPADFPIEQEVERVLVNRFVPASIVVNSEMEIVQFRGKTGDYLEPAAGHPTFSLSKMARQGLLVDLRTALNRAAKENVTVRKRGVSIQSNGGTRAIDLEVIPVQGKDSRERFYIVVFQEASVKTDAAVARKRTAAKANPKEASFTRENERLAREVRQLRGQLQSLIEDHEATSEEFKTANEEVLSSNEELQSSNEELETAQEELQSSNEELTTLNEELQNRIAELSVACNDWVNLLSNADIPVVMVSNDLRIRRFTPPAQKLLNLLPGDIGRQLGEIRSNLETNDLEKIVRETIDKATPFEHEVRERGGVWRLMRVRPYRTLENTIDGAVISFENIDSLKRALDENEVVRRHLDRKARANQILVLDEKFRVLVANPAFYRSLPSLPRRNRKSADF